ncbi:DedA family protein [Vibrio genomosp. F10]|uniref:VTT domain-containing protein n=1 Tax=Vibrio genomosp. F10 TaxID=723171 RepID=A0A1B9QVF0_9VIBR|nr:VTT domain-containing protein [Vibrio genomosp. F10]OCH72899.1 hypothetical protein A6E14_15205 [Vibrio genomosp. F10]
METVTGLLEDYGVLVYALLFLYCALKSGWLPLFAGYAAYLGALELPWVALATFLGGYLGDEIRFWVAKTYGIAWVDRSTTFGRLFEKSAALAQKYGTAYIFIYRYPKGLRTIGALPLGLTDIKWRKFTLLNMSSATLWVVVMVGGGFFFGETFDTLGIENLTTVSVLLLLVFLLSLLRVWTRDKRQKLTRS